MSRIPEIRGYRVLVEGKSLLAPPPDNFFKSVKRTISNVGGSITPSAVALMGSVMLAGGLLSIILLQPVSPGIKQSKPAEKVAFATPEPAVPISLTPFPPYKTSMDRFREFERYLEDLFS